MDGFQPKKKRFTADNVLDVVSNFYEVDSRVITGSSRIKNIVAIRWIVVYILRKYLNKSFPYIGKKLGNRDHTSVLYAYNKISDVIEKNSDIEEEVNSIVSYFKHGFPLKKLVVENTDHLVVKKQRDSKLKKVLNIIRSIEDLPNHELSSENKERQDSILEKYRDGYSLREIGETYRLTGERINQIVKIGLQNNVREIVEKGFVIDFREFLRKEKQRHMEALKNKRGVFEKEVAPKKIEFKWSRYYNFCRACHTTIVPHGAHGYCKKCYTKTDGFKEIQNASRLKNIEKIKAYTKNYSKEYNKRPDVIKRLSLSALDGNREKALIRDGYKCRACGMPREENYLKYGKDLNVVHKNGNKNHDIDNLITMCKNCHANFTTKRMRQNKKINKNGV